ncbi:hypothetical protein ACQ3I4_02170 [Zafaria sp. Z1313]|uniref:hypothetical protein n=1 Tax=unclassified Zafaria TaxID=2828765 RepID=UPI002E78D111|nr:hypothetical protein [Zafaria sp. J156]MEE1620178.1 hypothetical protein [Zafaria sp. J156]
MSAGRDAGQHPFEFGRLLWWAKACFWGMGACLGVALLLWLVAGGRAEFTTGTAPWSWRVLVPGWLSLAGLLLALAGSILFTQQMAFAILGRLDRSPLFGAKGRGRRR